MSRRMYCFAGAFLLIQDGVSVMTPDAALDALHSAEAKYRNALVSLPGHAEASYNLATCLSEQADLKRELNGAEAAAGEQVTFRSTKAPVLPD